MRPGDTVPSTTTFLPTQPTRPVFRRCATVFGTTDHGPDRSPKGRRRASR